MAKKKEIQEEPTGSGIGSPLQPELFPADDHYFMLQKRIIKMEIDKKELIRLLELQIYLLKNNKNDSFLIKKLIEKLKGYEK